MVFQKNLLLFSFFLKKHFLISQINKSFLTTKSLYMKKFLQSTCLFGLLLFFLIQPVFAQEISVSGTVTDENNVGIPGVSVFVKGTSTGTITDVDGKYTLKVSSGATLVFQSIGLATQEVVVGTESTIDVNMESSIKALDEVVVTGLGTSVKRSNLGNAVATISAQDLVGTTSPSTLDGGLYGKLTGANIVQTSGAPGGGIAIRLRGISSITGQNQPLYVVDGVYISNAEVPSGLRFASGANSGSEENSSNRLADLDPADIENIEILKGSAAAAIYGSRANAGVVIITTKKGKAGRTQVNFSQDVGFSTIINKIGQRPFTADIVQSEFGDNDLALFNQNGVFDYEDEIFGETGLILNSRISVTRR